MLTHEKVLKVFGPYLDADPDYEVVRPAGAIRCWPGTTAGRNGSALSFARPRRTCGMPC